MTERERWIVYPLLFLAIGTSLKDKFGVPSVVRAERIQCDSIDCTRQINGNSVVAERGRIGNLAATKNFSVLGPDNQPRVAIVALRTPATDEDQGQATSAYQGIIKLYDENRKLMCSVGNPTVCNSLITNDLRIRGGEFLLYGANDELKVKIGTTAITSPPDEDADGAEDKDQTLEASGSLVLLGPGGKTMVGLGTMARGGLVVVSHQDGDRYVLLNHNKLGSGLFVDEQGVVQPLQAVPPKPEAEQPDEPQDGDHKDDDQDANAGDGG